MLSRFRKTSPVTLGQRQQSALYKSAASNTFVWLATLIAGCMTLPGEVHLLLKAPFRCSVLPQAHSRTGAVTG